MIRERMECITKQKTKRKQVSMVPSTLALAELDFVCYWADMMAVTNEAMMTKEKKN